MKQLAWDFFDVTRRFACGWALAIGMLTCAIQSTAAAGDSGSVITRGDILVGAAEAIPPPDSASWQPVSLPDIWSKSRPGIRGHAWYRLHVDLPEQPQGRQALYFGRLRTVGAAFVNGREVGQSGEFGTATRVWGPQLFAFSPDLLRPGLNTVHVRLWVAPGYLGALAPVTVGPLAPLTDAFERERLLGRTFSQFVAVVAGVLGVMMLVIWLGRRHDSMFGWLAVACLSKALWITCYLGMIPGVRAWQATALLSAFMLAPLSIYCLRYAGWRWPRFEALVWILAVCHGLNIAAGGLWNKELPIVVGWPLLLFQFAAPIAIVLAVMHRRFDSQGVILVLAHVVSLAVAIQALFVQSLTGIDPWTAHTLPVYLVMAWILTRRFVEALNEAEHLNTDLERRVAEKHAELEREAARTQQLARDAAVAAERQRMMSDMHDGIGGQLISTLALLEAGDAPREQLAAALRESIDDLRLAIDSLEPTDEDLLPVLGNLRYRLEPRLKARGIELDWQVKDVPKLACLTPQNVLHVLRVIQEAFTNVLRHAGAKRIRVSTRSESGRVLIDVSDDGVGIQGEGRPGGHGLANMRRRMAALGGELLLQPSNKGTTVTLSLPEGQLQPA